MDFSKVSSVIQLILKGDLSCIIKTSTTRELAPKDLEFAKVEGVPSPVVLKKMTISYPFKPWSVKMPLSFEFSK